MLASLGASLVELPVALTADNQAVVAGHLTLETSTNVAEVFPDRRRGDGSYYLIDFTLDELRRLRLMSQTGKEAATRGDGIATLGEHLTLLRGLDRLLGRATGIVVDPASPSRL